MLHKLIAQFIAKFIAKEFALITIIVVVFIAYGSLYPFAFHRAPPGAVRALLEGWAKRPGRGDALANIMLYIPLGYFATAAIRREAGLRIRAATVILIGLSLSVSMELLQYYDAGRDTEATDVYTNVAGTAFGIAGAQWLGGYWSKLPRQRLADPAALLLLAAWAGYNMFPFVPVIDLHKYWDALKPLLHPVIDGYALFQHIAVWFAVAVLVGTASEGRQVELRFTAFAAFLLTCKIVIMGGVLTLAEVVAPPIALGLVFGLKAWPRERTIAACILLGCAVVAGRLAPFHFQAKGGSFSWIPFLSFMYGSLEIDTLSFLEKSFLYGSLIWLLQRIGLRLALATLLVAAALLATSLAEIYLPGRSAEITDAIMALFSGGVIALVRSAAAPQNAAA